MKNVAGSLSTRWQHGSKRIWRDRGYRSVAAPQYSPTSSGKPARAEAKKRYQKAYAQAFMCRNPWHESNCRGDGRYGFIGKYIIDNLLARGFHVRD